MKTKKTLLLGLACMLTGSLFAADYTPDVYWTGATGDSLWNETSQNWKATDASAATFANGKKVAFDDGMDEAGGIGYRYVKVGGKYTVGGMLFDSDKNYTIAATEDSTGMNGDFQLIKKGQGTLRFFGQDFYLWPSQGTIIEEGSIEIAGPAATSNNIQEQVLGPQIVFHDGTSLELTSLTHDKHGYETLPWDFVLEAGANASFKGDRNYLHVGKLTGDKESVLNINLRFQREHFGGNWSEYEGTINVTAENLVSGSGGCLILCDTLAMGELDAEGNFIGVYPRTEDAAYVRTEGNQYITRYPLGYPKARIHLNDAVTMLWGADTGSSPAKSMNREGAYVTVGALSGTAGSYLSLGFTGNSKHIMNWVIGCLNTNEVFEGSIITGGYKTVTGTATNIFKVGTGDWRLTGNHTNKGNFTVKEGSLTMLGSATTGGSVVVESKGTLKGNPVFTAATKLDVSGVLEPGDSTIDHSLGTMQFQAADISFNEGAVLKIGLGKGRSDVLQYYGEMNFDFNSTIEFFVEENTVAAGDTFRVLIPYNNSINASIVGEPQIICQEGLVLNTMNLLTDPKWLETDAEKALCGIVVVESNTAVGKYSYESVAPTVVSISPEADAYIGRKGSIVINFVDDIKLGAGNITIGGVVASAAVEENVLTLNYEGLPAESATYELIIPAGAIVAAADAAPCAEIRYNYQQDVVAPAVTAQSLAEAAEISWEDGSMTITYSENIKIVNAKGITINRTQLEKLTPSVSGSELRISYIGLNFASEYTLNIAEGAIADIADNAAPAFAIHFTTKGYDNNMPDSVALNGKASTSVPVLQLPLDESSTNSYPLWVQYKEGSFANGEVTWTSNNSNNKVMSAFLGDAKSLHVTARRSGEEAVGLTIQESPAEASVVTWRTIQELTEEDLALENKVFSWNLNPGCRFIKIKATKASATSSVIVAGYQVLSEALAVEKISNRKISSYTTNDGVQLLGLEAGSRIGVYNLAGVCTAELTATSSDVFVPAQGFVLVKVSSDKGTSVIKAIVK